MEFNRKTLSEIFLLCQKRDIFFDNPGPGIMIRHDVDDDLSRSVECAYVENDFGIKATYFILNTAPYYRPDSRHFWSQLKTIESLGHRIEWHNNAIAQWIKGGRKRPVIEIVDEVLSRFLANGFPVTGSASHGDSTCYDSTGKHYFLNHQCFKESLETVPLSDTFKHLFPTFEPFPMGDCALEWEAYFVQHDEYFSEPGGKWKNFPTAEKLSDTSKRFQILIHPQWWTL